MTRHVQWAELPPSLRALIEAETGTVTRTEEVAEGLNCFLALVIHTGGGPLFLKGVRTSSHAEHAQLTREQQVNPLVSGLGLCPEIRHAWSGAGWHCLAFVYVPGVHPALSPGSPDVDAVAAALRRLQHTQAPPLAVPPLTERYADQLLPGEAALLTGPYLLHTDTNPHNFLISDDGTAHVIDWAMPASGPAWVDAAYTAVRLMECGHTGEQARAWLAGFASWRDAEPKAVETFVDVVCRHWTATVGDHDARPSNARFLSLIHGR